MKSSYNYTNKTVIGMCHLLPLPGDVNFNHKDGIRKIIEVAKRDIEILQNNGLSGILFSNEFSYPYSQKIDQVTVATMSRIIGELKKEISIPFGVDCMYDSKSTIDLACATDADFFRITMPIATITEYEFGFTMLYEIIKHRKNVFSGNNPHMFINITPTINNLSTTKIEELISFIIAQVSPYALCIAANKIENLIKSNSLNKINNLCTGTYIYCDGGCNISNIESILNYTSGIIVGTAFKNDYVIYNSISQKNTNEFMIKVKSVQNNSKSN